jgi:hypothetical protein
MSGRGASFHDEAIARLLEPARGGEFGRSHENHRQECEEDGGDGTDRVVQRARDRV